MYYVITFELVLHICITSFFIFSSFYVLYQLFKGGKIDEDLVDIVKVLMIVGVAYMCMHIINDIRSLYARNVFDYLIYFEK